ncbi:hypothetical protein ACPWT1_08215 [Ramlibacter sp. MMS24-I3-19]|uniref:hypothetical protein n=1 Tax=Ramlibacter sp. MMS24-I3-19 TaxID=3416606 RepID=UPI003D063021
MKTLVDRDWSAVAAQLESRTPRHVVLDDFLTPTAAERVHKELLQHWGWRKKNWVSAHLHNARPRIETCACIATEFIQAAGPVIDGLEICDYWALLYPKNSTGNVHADAGRLTLTLWLTPDRHNLTAGTGGLVLYDVNRHPSQMLREYLVPPASVHYVRKHSAGNHIHIPYRWNRAVLFDATTFHRTDDLHFDIAAGMHAARMNLSFAIDNLAEYYEQFERDGRREKHASESAPAASADEAYEPE